VAKALAYAGDVRRFASANALAVFIGVVKSGKPFDANFAMNGVAIQDGIWPRHFIANAEVCIFVGARDWMQLSENNPAVSARLLQRKPS
jgi:hypothetical protein